MQGEGSKGGWSLAPVPTSTYGVIMSCACNDEIKQSGGRRTPGGAQLLERGAAGVLAGGSAELRGSGAHDLAGLSDLPLKQQVERISRDMLITHAPPSRQDLEAGGEQLRSWGLFLDAHGQVLGPTEGRCGNVPLLHHLRELARSGIPASALDAGGQPSRPSGSWFGEDMRGRPCCSRDPVNQKRDLRGLSLSDVNKLVSPLGLATGREQRGRPKALGWSDALRSDLGAIQPVPIKRDERFVPKDYKDRDDTGGSSVHPRPVAACPPPSSA